MLLGRKRICSSRKTHHRRRALVFFNNNICYLDFLPDCESAFGQLSYFEQILASLCYFDSSMNLVECFVPYSFEEPGLLGRMMKESPAVPYSRSLPCFFWMNYETFSVKLLFFFHRNISCSKRFRRSFWRRKTRLSNFFGYRGTFRWAALPKNTFSLSLSNSLSFLSRWHYITFHTQRVLLLIYAAYLSLSCTRSASSTHALTPSLSLSLSLFSSFSSSLCRCLPPPNSVTLYLFLSPLKSFQFSFGLRSSDFREHQKKKFSCLLAFKWKKKSRCWSDLVRFADFFLSPKKFGRRRRRLSVGCFNLSWWLRNRFHRE